ncbi:maleylpyruvate isomerase family mycothiol-dependent enzyme [Cellulomonas fimi]|uniref:Maleylpyruvate isomerase family mycothiol-dependent enzyme n=1 Tax=Cellulomonas fimi TaxID=1708 RepID=A0A7Y0M086_CELFI|nr:maleylpyruvate isomerase family mycothiol-dependent enzyme [Cellulomonas fimi]NMR21201.1 maleylpyruvate isomerase family mycothiol-dependent enzyme [Cellulomonas fimi]
MSSQQGPVPTSVDPSRARAGQAVTGAPGPTAGELVAAIARSEQQLGGAMEPLTDAQVAAPSALPGWTRGHVLAHLVGVGAALARQIEHALRDELVDLYDGGQPARDAAVDAGAGLPAREHVRAVRRTVERIDGVLGRLAPQDWVRRVRFRDADVRDVALAWWRECSIHAVDLELGVGSEDWSRALCDHLTVFLAERVPVGTRLVLDADDEAWVRELGSGRPTVVRGRRADLVAWLAGRELQGRVEAAEHGELPVLGPWPAGIPRPNEHPDAP